MFDLMGVSKGYAITQLALVVNALWGIFVFQEVTEKSAKGKIYVGLAVALTGGILLSFSAS